MKYLVLIAAFVAAYECVAVNQIDCSRFHEESSCSNLAVAKRCGFTTECIETVWKNQPVTQNNGEVCEFCESVVNDIRSQFSEQTEDQVIQYLDSICLMCPEKEVQTECQNVVNQYGPEIFQMIRAELDPQTVCSALGLCPGMSVEPTLTDAILLQGAPISVEQPAAPAPVSVSQPQSGDVCQDCKQLITDLEALMTNSSTEQEIADYLKQFCTYAGGMEKECDALVDAYLPQLMAIIKAEMDPDMVCQALDLCTGTINHLYLTRMKLRETPLYQVASTQSANGGEECAMCMTIMAELQTLDRDQATQEEIKNFLKSEVCSHFGAYIEQCNASIDTYAPLIFEFLANELDPDTRCKSLGFCTARLSVPELPPAGAVPAPDVLPAAGLISATRDATPATSPVELGPSTQCILCEFVMNKLKNMLTVNATEQEILDAVEKVCSLLPDTISQECVTFIDKYGPAIITLLTSEITPEEVCQELGLCASLKHDEDAERVVFQPSGVQGDEECGVCETIIQYIDSLLEEHSTQEAIDEVLQKVCNYMPQSFKADCTDFINTYGPAVLDILVNELSPEVVCTEIHLCGNKKQQAASVPQMELIQPQKQQLLGEEECTWGPSYWCASEENARKCGTTQHCLDHGLFNQN